MGSNHLLVLVRAVCIGMTMVAVACTASPIRPKTQINVVTPTPVTTTRVAPTATPPAIDVVETSAIQPVPTDAFLNLTFTDAAPYSKLCGRVLLGISEVSHAECGGELLTTPYRPYYREEIDDQIYRLTTRYRSFTGTLFGGTLIFQGNGLTHASATEQRMIAEWAFSIYEKHYYANYGASHSLVFRAMRKRETSEKTLEVYRNGTYWISTSEQLRLIPTDQLAVLYRWLAYLDVPHERNQTNDYERKDGSQVDDLFIAEPESIDERPPVESRNALFDFAQSLLDDRNLPADDIDSQSYAAGAVHTDTVRSPNRQWVADIVIVHGDMGRSYYYQRLSVRSAVGAAQYTAVARWSRSGLGYDLPAIVKWSADGQALYYTKSFVGDGCQLFSMTGPLMRLNLISGKVEALTPVSNLSPDEKWAVGAQGLEIGVYSIANPEQGRTVTITVPSSEPDTQIGDFVWRSDSQSFTYARVPHPCSNPGDLQAGRIITEVDLATLSQKLVTVVTP